MHSIPFQTIHPFIHPSMLQRHTRAHMTISRVHTNTQHERPRNWFHSGLLAYQCSSPPSHCCCPVPMQSPIHHAFGMRLEECHASFAARRSKNVHDAGCRAIQKYIWSSVACGTRGLPLFLAECHVCHLCCRMCMVQTAAT